MKRVLTLLLALLLLPLLAARPEAAELFSASDWDRNDLYPDAPLPEAGSFQPRDGGVPCQGLEDAAIAIRETMTARGETLTLELTLAGDGRSFQELTSEFYHQALTAAQVHTGVPWEGDYLTCHYSSSRMKASGSGNSSGYRASMTITFSYKTTAAQEAMVTAAVGDLLAQLGVSDMASDFRKVQAIYDWIYRQVDYDYTHLPLKEEYPLMYTAYAALLDRTAVCQGFSALFCRLALTAGVPARCIRSIPSEQHMWNIVCLDGLWYSLDATWESNYRDSQGAFYQPYNWFLQCDASFRRQQNHNPADGSPCFSLPMAVWDYSASRTLTLPAALQVLDREALQGTAARVIVIPAGVTHIEGAAFSGCRNLEELIFLGSPESLAPDLLDGCAQVSIQASAGSSPARWALEHGCPLTYF